MRVPRLRLAALAAASGIILSGCAYDMYGDPYGYGYGPYSGVSVGIGYGGGYGGYGGYGYPYSGYGYGDYDPFGWYGDYYYPGSGIYVYDRYRNRHQWNDEQRRYWENRRDHWQHRSGATSTIQNWSGWDRSHWRNSTSNSGTWNRSNWQNRSSATTSGVRERRSDGDSNHHRHGERSDERPQ